MNKFSEVASHAGLAGKHSKRIACTACKSGKNMIYLRNNKAIISKQLSIGKMAEMYYRMKEGGGRQGPDHWNL